MEYKVYKLKFKSAVHFGNGSIDRSDYRFCADTLFSALCIEALKHGKDTLDTLIQLVDSDQVRFSDAFPYIERILFLPKPALKVHKYAQIRDLTLKKAYQDISYIPYTAIEEYLNGNFNIKDTLDLSRLGSYDMRVSASCREKRLADSYHVSSFSFYEGCGLYIIIGYQEEEQLHLIQDLLASLSYSGIGGKRSSGYGRFELFLSKLPLELKARLDRKDSWQMLLSVALPQEEELEEALIDAAYHLIKRSGFITSEHYSSEQLRKKDLYVFASGSCFRTSFWGNLYDVSAAKGEHPVYRYAKPLFLGVDV